MCWINSGHSPTKKTTKDYWYLSPLRAERTASFKVNLQRNAWYDFGSMAKAAASSNSPKPGYKARAQPHAYPDALKWLAGLSGIRHTVKPYIHIADQEEAKRIELVSTAKLRSEPLTGYLEERGIPLAIAHQYLREIKLLDHETGNTMRSIGFKNNAGGYENRNRYFKGCTGHKSITTIRGKNHSTGRRAFVQKALWIFYRCL